MKKERIILAEGQPWFSYNKHKTFPDHNVKMIDAEGWTVPFCKPYNEDDLITPGKRWRLVLEEI